MQLSLRLTAIAEMVTEGNRLVDVGCDHGYLPVYLVQNKRIPAAIAMDVRKGPLSRADEHIAQYGMLDYIETRLSDGLEALHAGEGDTLVIAGMGGPLMERILEQGGDVTESFKEMILQPQSDIPHFRKLIREKGWELVQETMILDDGKYYPMMKVKKAEAEQQPYTKEEEWFGRFLLKEKHPVLKEYLLRELRIRNEILERLRLSEGEGAQNRIAEIEEEKQLVETALKVYENN